MAARIRQGDMVYVISGKDKKKTGKVLKVIADENKVVVEGLNVVKRHTKPSPRNEQGGIFTKEAPMDQSKVMLIDPKTGKATRIKFKEDDKGNKVRVAKSGEVIAYPEAGKAKAAG